MSSICFFLHAPSAVSASNPFPFRPFSGLGWPPDFAPLPLGCAEPPSSLPALPAAPGQHHHCSHYKCYFPGPFTKFHVPVWAWNPAWHPGLGLGPAQSVIRQEIPLLPVWSCSWCRCSAATHADAVHLSCLCGRGSGCSRNPSSPLNRPTPTHGGIPCGMRWCCQEAEKYMVPEPLSSTQQHGLTLKMNPRGHVINV